MSDPDSVVITPLSDGPLSASIEVMRGYAIPAAYDTAASARSAETHRLTVTDTYEIRSGEAFVRVTTRFENPSKDHRLRLHFPLPFKPTGSDAQTPSMSCTARLRQREVHTRSRCRHIRRGFVDVSGPDGGLALLFAPVTEYEVVDDEIALTLLRSVGMLSQRDMKYRPLPAGPDVPAPEAQCLGEHEFSYAICPHPGDWFEAGLCGLADRFAFPLHVADTRPVPDPTINDVLGIDGQNIQISACYRDHGRPTLRFWSTRNGGRIATRHEATEVDILGRQIEGEEERSNEFLLDPFEIKTIAIT